MIKVVGAGTPEERIRRLEHSVNFSEANRPFMLVGSPETVDNNAPAIGTNLFGACAVDRRVFRELLPDDRWVLYAAGFVNPDGATVAVQLGYLDNLAALTTLGSPLVIGAGSWAKQVIGPIDLWATVPKTEDVPVLVLLAQSSAASQLAHWTLWIRYLASKV